MHKFRPILLAILPLLMLAACRPAFDPPPDATPASPPSLEGAAGDPASDPDALPDLTISRATIFMEGAEGQCVDSYANLITTICVTNIGQAPTGQFVVGLEDSTNPERAIGWVVTDLAVGEEFCHSESENYDLAWVDVGFEVDESDERNNTAIVPIEACTD